MTGRSGFEFHGVVEGFYGAVWSEAQRFRFIDRLRPFGIDTYVYCPKHDPALGSEARLPLGDADGARLGALARFCGERGIAPWAGLHLEAPFDLGRPEDVEGAAQKLIALAGLGYTGFAILFDDLPPVPQTPDAPSQADQQASAFRGIHARVSGAGVEANWALCPSLYTLDPILAWHHGPFEPDYLKKLDAGLPDEVAWFWTGPRVCSPSISLEDAAAFLGDVRRELLLWDNYPVNDAGMIHQLHLGPLSGRAAELTSAVKGYLFNPLLQPALGALPGATCLAYAADPAAYDPAAAWERALAAEVPAELHGEIAALEALTRHSCLSGGKSTPPPDHPLAQGLRAGWQGGDATAVENTASEIAAVAEAPAGLLELLERLRRGLPEDMAREAAPWLERLEQARRILQAHAGEGGLDSAQAEATGFRAGAAVVLGDWFEP